MIENNLRHSSAVGKAGDEYGLAKLGSFCEVKVNSFSQGRSSSSNP